MTDSVQAKLRVMKKALLKKQGHPPDKKTQTNKTTRPFRSRRNYHAAAGIRKLGTPWTNHRHTTGTQPSLLAVSRLL